MKPVPRGYVAVCWVMAIGCSALAGLQAGDPDATRIAIYVVAALGSAVLPTRRAAGVTAAILGVAALGWVGYLVAPSWPRIALWAGGRGPAPLAAAGAWLVAGGGFRALRA